MRVPAETPGPPLASRRPKLLEAHANGGSICSDRPVLLKTEMGSGHSGPSGRYESWREEAYIMAFVMEQLGHGS